MAQETIRCPKCGNVIKITEAISQDIESSIKVKYEKEMESRLIKERSIIEEKWKKIAEKKAKEQVEIEISDLKDQVLQKSRQLEIAKQQELDLRKRQRAVEDKERALDIEIERTLDKERKQLIEKGARERDEAYKLKDADKDKQLADMKTQIEELKRKADQGSQKLQGEVLELELEQLFSREFPFDIIEPIASGIKGADILQIVKTQAGRDCGKILWETKRTKNWSDTWIQKLKDDQRDSKADIAVIVSEILPKGFHHFRQIDTIWVTDIPSAISLGLALRTILIQVARTKDVQTGKEEKMEVVYNYLIGAEFRNRVQAIMESFINMRRDLDSEKRAMESIWAKREKQITRVITNIAGMRGDLEGMVGPALPSIKLLELDVKEEK